MKFRRIFSSAALLVAGTLSTFSAHLQAQSYPAKAVRIVVPFAAGGGTDIQARVLGKYLQEQFSQPFIVDNRAGASGLIGALRVRASP